MERTFPTLMQSMHNRPGHHYRGRVPLMMEIASTLMNKMPGMSTTSCSRCYASVKVGFLITMYLLGNNV